MKKGEGGGGGGGGGHYEGCQKEWCYKESDLIALTCVRVATLFT